MTSTRVSETSRIIVPPGGRGLVGPSSSAGAVIAASPSCRRAVAVPSPCGRCGRSGIAIGDAPVSVRGQAPPIFPFVDDGAGPSGVLLVQAWVQDGEVVARLR